MSLEQNSINACNRYMFKLNDFLVDKKGDGIDKYYDNSDYPVTINKEGFRCDEFLKKHSKKHVLFSGCSHTFGYGSKYEEVWSHTLYNKLLSKEPLSGYFNLGVEGASVIEIITNIYRYIRKYAKPDVIFLLLPDIERDHIYLKNPQILATPFIIEFYKQFEDYCISNNIKLISTTWVIPEQDLSWYKLEDSLSITKPDYKFVDETGHMHPSAEDPYFEFGIRNPYDQFVLLEKNVNTFKNMDSLKFSKKLYEYCKQNKDRKDLMETLDGSKHYGIAYHNAWSEYFYERYENEKNNIQD
jgi:hypothetical protein